MKNQKCYRCGSRIPKDIKTYSYGLLKICNDCINKSNREIEEFNPGDLVDVLCHGGWACAEAQRPPKETISKTIGECGSRYCGHDYIWIKDRGWWPAEKVRFFRSAEDEQKRQEEQRERWAGLSVSNVST